MINIDNVSKTFGKVAALKQVSCCFRDGEITGLLGLNGAGKTTLMRCIYGLLPVDDGRITLNEYDISSQPTEARKITGVLPDDTGLYKRLTALENILYFARLQGLPEAECKRQAESLINVLGMQEIADRRTDGFSLGERMKTALARAIVHQPQHILLDEPTNGLDVITTRAVRKLLLDLRDEGRCVVFSSHLMHEVEKLCDNLVVIASGSVVAQGSVQDILDETGFNNLEDAFISLSQREVTTHVE